MNHKFTSETKRFRLIKQPNLSGDEIASHLIQVNPALVRDWLVAFLRDEIIRRRNYNKAIIGLSGGVDSALVAYLCAEALGPKNVVAIRMPYRTSNPESLEHAQLVIDALGIETRTIEITGAVEGYIGAYEPEASGRRRGNVMARQRMIIIFDQSERYHALPVGTGNKSERLFGYYTWHADDSPPINPIGDLYKTQVWELARFMGVPSVIVDKPASADLIQGQTDEGDFGISYYKADKILALLLRGYNRERIIESGFPASEVDLVKGRLDSTHWKRHLPTTAMLSSTSINDYYLRPVDY
ncbi:MAG: NAD+ synthase [Chloroflexi bacterium]|uniref:NH(3)-dependent NAD(+) synthetase n=1 Tax=Candidatus Chlorohelix allophototropha TaxID=3003348 RepID=A0A8T7M157_9CHLR|nr:NAD+ synthase [Chloroflexota bacterium]WJW66249.1 NAD+ synthase [Chloroflexota bacterium L227-S17]